jgi:hypothetical protein
MDIHQVVETPSLEKILAADQWARKAALASA